MNQPMSSSLMCRSKGSGFRAVRWGRGGAFALLAAALCAGSLSCGGEAPKPPPPPRYETLPPKDLPAYLRGTVLERMDHLNAEPLQISNYGLVVNLPGTGDGTAPMIVRQYIIKEMLRRGFGSANMPGYEGITPESVLDDAGRRTAIVRADGFMPPGVRKGQTFDVVVTALGDSSVTSLAGGSLYRTDLKFGGADARDPAGVIEVQGKAEGAIFINPTLMLNPRASVDDKNASRLSRRQGVILDGGIADRDQPLILRMRAPQRSVIRQIERRIQQHFQDPAVASAKDEAVLHLYIPSQYNGDWERFLGVCNHLYLDGTPEVLSVRAKQLAAEAVKPDAPLQNISYAWEAMGVVALPAILPLTDPKYTDDIQFAAARAAAHIGSADAQASLMRIAQTSTHRFQIDAIRSLGALKSTPAVTAMLRRLLNADSALARIEAYKVLAARGSPAVFSIFLPKAGVDERFVLDVVQSSQPTVVYATRSGIPRIAIIGQPARVVTPITFTALDDRLSISAAEAGPGVTIFHRRDGGEQPVKVTTRTDLAEIVGWLGGAAKEPRDRIDLSYGEIVAIVQALSDQKRLFAAETPGVAATFVLQDAPAVSNQISDAPPIPGRSRPQTEDKPVLPTTRIVGPELGEKDPTRKPAAEQIEEMEKQKQLQQQKAKPGSPGT